MAEFLYKNIGLALDLENWEGVNNNFKKISQNFTGQNSRIDGIVDEITGDLAQQIVDDSKIVWLSPVDAFTDLSNVYPTPSKGDTVMVRADGKVYRWNGLSWQEIQDIDPTAINEIDTRLSAGLSQKKSATFINVEEHGAKNDGSADVSVIVQTLLNQGYKKLAFPAGTFLFESPLLIHDRAGLVLKGTGSDGTIFKAGTNLQFATDRLPAIGLDGNYDKKAFIVVTFYDGETKRLNRASRNINVKGITFDGSSHRREIIGISTQGIALSTFKDIKGIALDALFDLGMGNTANGDSYSLTFDHIRTVDCTHHIKQYYGAKPYVGTSWRLIYNSIDKNKYGFTLNGISYATLDNCTVDNIEKGSYAIDLYKCRTVTINNPGVEVRYQKDGEPNFENYGGGFFRFVDTNVNLNGGFFLGGDRFGLGNGVITDYQLSKSLMLISGDSRVVFINPFIDAQKNNTTTNLYPLYCENTSSLFFVAGKGIFQEQYVSVFDTANAEILNFKGEKISLPLKYKGVALFNGNGTTTTFVIKHGLGVEPIYYHAQAGSYDAGVAVINDVKVNTTDLIVRFKNPPITGSNNIVIPWRADKF